MDDLLGEPYNTNGSYCWINARWSRRQIYTLLSKSNLSKYGSETVDLESTHGFGYTTHSCNCFKNKFARAMSNVTSFRRNGGKATRI